MKKVFTILLAILLLAGCFVACGDKNGELKKGTIVKTEENVDSSTWRSLTTSARDALDETYQQKLAATQTLAEVPAVSGTTYYISSINGNDGNSGKSPEQAWKSPSKASVAKSGDAVLFECGSVFRRASNAKFLTLKSGVTYATYGNGAKPIFYGSINASDSNLWKPISGKQNLYYYKNPIPIDSDVGSIVFNDGAAWGIKVQMIYATTKGAGVRGYRTLTLTGVSNGLQTNLTVPEYDLTTGSDLKGPDLSFYHDTKYVYLYCEGGNPGERFSSIELSQGSFAFSGSSISNVTVLNLDFRNFGNHCIRTDDCKNLTVKNCEFRFIGGTVQMDYGDWRNYDTRLGNAIENWNSCNGMVIENCFFDQAYDTAMTTQSTSAVSTQNVTYRNNVAQNMWFGVELWTTSGQVFQNVDVSGNYFKNIGEGFCSQRPDKIDEGTDYSVNAFIKVSDNHYQMANFSVTDNIADGTNGKMVFCTQLKTNDNPDGVLFDRNTYVATTNVDFARFFGKTSTGRTYSYTQGGIAAVHALGVETNGVFYYTEAGEQSFAYDRIIDSLPLYTYKAANGVELPFRLIFPEGYTAGASYPLVTYLNDENASGTDNVKNVTETKQIIAKLIAENKAILLVPQCPSGTWTGLKVNTGNYSTSSTSETDVMKAVAAMIRDVANEFKTGKKYAVGVDAGAYAVSDLLVRHQNLLSAGVIIAGAGDASASIGDAKAMVVHAPHDYIIDKENAQALAAAWNAELVLYDDLWDGEHGEELWNYVAEHTEFFDWLLTK